MKKGDIKKIIAIGAVASASAAAAAIIISQYRKHKISLAEQSKALARVNAYITGGGLSAFASALYLIRDCGLNPSNVHVLSNGSYNRGNEKTGYICGRNKITDEKNSMNLFDLLKDVNSLDVPDLTVCDEILNIYRSNPNARRVAFIDEDKNVGDISDVLLDKTLRSTIISLLRTKREKLRSATIYEAMSADFFNTPFWKLLSAAYGFTSESSAYEFVNCILHMGSNICGTMPSGFDSHEEIIDPLKEHLKQLGADIREAASVTDIDFENGKAEAVHFTDNGIRKTVYLNDGDICIFPTDEMAECEAFGSFSEPAPKIFTTPYQLWEKLAMKSEAFNDPSVFFDEFDSQMAEEFTITLSNRLLPELIDKVTCGALGIDGAIILDNSNWKLAICAVPSTHFKNQSDDIAVIWGTASCFERDGKYSGKPMTECSGAEILYELVSCLNLQDAWDDIRETVINVIPCHRKYDRAFISPVPSKLEIIPTGISNMAVSGDFAESDCGAVFSAEYSVATARAAAYRLMNTKKKMFTVKPDSIRTVKRFLKNLAG